MKQRNFVAKHSTSYNKAKVYKDRKKDVKKGYMKHKKPSNNDGFSLTTVARRLYNEYYEHTIHNL